MPEGLTGEAWPRLNAVQIRICLALDAGAPRCNTSLHGTVYAYVNGIGLRLLVRQA